MNDTTIEFDPACACPNGADGSHMYDCPRLHDGEGHDEPAPGHEDAPAQPSNPALVGLPGPLREDGTPQTLQEIRAELPAGASGEAIDISLRNLMTAPQKTLAIIARKAYELGATGRPHVHHAVCADLGDGSDTIRILLLTADEPRDPAVVAAEEAEREAKRQAAQADGTIRSVMDRVGLKRRGVK